MFYLFHAATRGSTPAPLRFSPYETDRSAFISVGKRQPPAAKRWKNKSRTYTKDFEFVIPSADGMGVSSCVPVPVLLDENSNVDNIRDASERELRQMGVLLGHHRLFVLNAKNEPIFDMASSKGKLELQLFVDYRYHHS